MPPLTKWRRLLVCIFTNNVWIYAYLAVEQERGLVKHSVTFITYQQAPALPIDQAIVVGVLMGHRGSLVRLLERDQD